MEKGEETDSAKESGLKILIFVASYVNFILKFKF